MAAAISSALLSGSAAVLDRRGVSDARASSRRASSSSAAAGPAVSLLPASIRRSSVPSRSGRLNRLAARASVSSSASSAPLVTDSSHGVLSGEWDKSASLVTFEDLSHHLQGYILRGLAEDSESASTEPQPLASSRRHGIVSGEWDENVSRLHYEELSKFFEAALVQGLEEDSEYSPLETDRSHGVLSGEWDKSISLLSYEDLSVNLLEKPVPLVTSRSHGVLSGEWDKSVTLRSYEDVLYHLEGKIGKGGK